MILYYKSSNGQDYNLKVGHLRMRTADFHTYTWTPAAVTQQYGERPYRFEKAPMTYTAQLSVFGTMDEKKTFLNLLHAAFDHDIYNMTPGKIVHGEYEIECYITMSSTYYDNPYIYNDLTIYCPYPAWKREIKTELREADEIIYPFLGYPHGYNYDYKGVLPGYAQVINTAEAPAQYKLVIYGAVTNPLVMVDDIAIGVNATIGANERVEISSIDKTVISYGSVKKNLFNQRVKTSSLFNRIAPGEHTILWSGNFNADLILYEERSEPLWI